MAKSRDGFLYRLSNTKQKKLCMTWLLIIFGTGIMAFAAKSIFAPMNLVTGGFSGICIMIQDITRPYITGGVPLWLSNLILNIPLILLALRIRGKEFILSTAIATVIYTGWLFVFPEMNLVEGDYALAAIFGGGLVGLGLGCIFLAQTSTGQGVRKWRKPKLRFGQSGND